MRSTGWDGTLPSCLNLLGDGATRDRFRFAVQESCRQQLAHDRWHASGEMQLAHHVAAGWLHVGELRSAPAHRVDV